MDSINNCRSRHTGTQTINQETAVKMMAPELTQRAVVIPSAAAAIRDNLR